MSLLGGVSKIEVTRQRRRRPINRRSTAILRRACGDVLVTTPRGRVQYWTTLGGGLRRAINGEYYRCRTSDALTWRWRVRWRHSSTFPIFHPDVLLQSPPSCVVAYSTFDAAAAAASNKAACSNRINLDLQRAAILRAIIVTAALSDRPPHAGIVSKRMNVGWCRLYWRVAYCFQFWQCEAH